MQEYSQPADPRPVLPHLDLGQMGRRLQQALVDHLDDNGLPYNGMPPQALVYPSAATARPWQPPPAAHPGFATERTTYAKAWQGSPAYSKPMPPVRTLAHGVQGSPMGVHDYASPTNSAVSTNTNTSTYGVSTPHSAYAPAWQPLSAPACVRQYGAFLTEFEQSEIFDYRNIYCFGKGAKKVRGNTLSPASNFGYDDEKGDYRVIPGDHVAYRYEVISVLGQGSFGQVMQVYDHKHQCKLALKIIRNKKRFHHQAMVEVNILQRLLDSDPFDAVHVVRMHEHFTFRNHLCIVFELLHVNLYDHLKAHDFVGLPLSAVRHVASQMLRALLFLRQQGIVHCDIKPENVLLKDEWSYDVKLIDFGSSCYEGKTMYTYIQSRFYRAPEVIMGLPYGGPIDMWSLACVLAELLTGCPLFPGENEHQQLLCMTEVLGLPPRYMVQAAPRANLFFDTTLQPRIVPNQRGLRRYPATTDLRGTLGCNDVAFLSFLQGCLQWDAGARLTVEQALQHPFITQQPMAPRRGGAPREGRHKSRSLVAVTDQPKRRKPSSKGVAQAPIPAVYPGSVSGFAPSVAVLPAQYAMPVTYSGAFWNDVV